MEEKQINLYQGHICVKNNDGRLCFVNDSCIQKIKERIDIFIEKNPKQFRIKDIIFSVLKDYFKISKIFKTPNSKNVIPSQDPLYLELSHYIMENTTYIKRKQKNTDLYKEKLNTVYKNKREAKLFDYYEKDKVNRLKR